MSVPNHSQIVQAVYAQGGYSLTTKEGAGQFTEAACLALYAVDPNWGHLRKPAWRTHVVGPDGNLHAVDVVLYKSAGAIVDIIRDAGEPGAGLSWGVGADDEYDPDALIDGKPTWYAPTGEPAPTPEPEPDEPSVMPPYPGDQFGSALGDVLFADYAEAGQAPNPGMGVWFSRTDYDYVAFVVGGMPPADALQASLVKHRHEWRSLLGLPVI